MNAEQFNARYPVGTPVIAGPEPGSCPAFVPDAPRAPGLCARCGDARRWHQAPDTSEAGGVS